MGILSHVSIGSTKEKLSDMIELYDTIMPMLGAKRQMAVAKEGKIDTMVAATNPDLVTVAYGKYFPEFWVGLPFDEQEATAGNGVHICFNCSSESMVQQIYHKALEMGAKDNGPPGPRPQYDDKYYAAYFIDPCGNKMEVLFYNLGMMGYCDIL